MLNDKDMDVLIGRYARRAAHSTPVEHPDADELNAFAEGGLPPVARQRYLSHFADCDDCRKLVSQLAVTTGVGVEARIPASEPVAEPWWRKLGAVFAIPALRYAAFGVVLLAVVGIAFLVWRPSTERRPDMIAQTQPQTDPVEAVKPAATSGTETARYNDTQRNTNSAVVLQPTVPPSADQNKSGLTSSDPPSPPPKPVDALAAKESAPVATGAARTDNTVRPEASPSYAPAPPAETYRTERRERAQQTPGAMPGGPRRNDSYDKSRVDRERSGDFAKARDDEDRSANQPTTETKKAEAMRRPSSVADEGGRAVQEVRQARKSAAVTSSEEAPEMRSAGGRKFKRQGNAWVDSKFKSSMSVRTVARGSEEFAELNSGLRSIANQLSGEIIVVWKGKAYRIR